jgi:hypothetical protein
MYCPNCKILPLLLALVPGVAGCLQRLPSSDLIEIVPDEDMGNDIAYDTRHIPAGLRKMVQYQRDTIMNILEFDQRGRLVFKYYKQYEGKYLNGLYLTMLSANVYEGSRLVKHYELHSNAGLQVWYYEPSWTGMKLNCYHKENDYDQDTAHLNGNAFRFVEKITSWLELLNHPKVTELEKVSEKRLVEQIIYNKKGLIDERKYYNKADNLECRSIYEYAAGGLLSRKHEKYVDSSRYVANISNITRFFYTPAKKIAMTVVVNAAKDTTDLAQYSYGPQGELVQKLKLEDKGDLTQYGLGTYRTYGKISNQYDLKGAVIRADYSRITKYINGQLSDREIPITATILRRNKEGFVIERREIEYLPERKKEHYYRYDYYYF